MLRQPKSRPVNGVTLAADAGPSKGSPGESGEAVALNCVEDSKGSDLGAIFSIGASCGDNTPYQKQPVRQETQMLLEDCHSPMGTFWMNRAFDAC